MAGAAAEIEAAGGRVERVAVPGALEIPQVLAPRRGRPGSSPARNRTYAGAIALGCVIRGETAHYDIVCNNANHWLMDVALRHGVPLGNGILTVENEAQALERARGGREGKGGDAARACLRMIEVAQQFGRESAANPPPGRRLGAQMKAAKKKADAGGARPRSVARMAAVQALYQMDLAGTDVGEVIDEFVSRPLSGCEGG